MLGKKLGNPRNIQKKPLMVDDYLNGVYRKPWSQGPLFWAAVTLERVGLTSDEIPSSSKKSRVFGDDLYKAR